MTVSTTQNRIVYTGDGVTLAFAFPYKFIQSSDLLVYVANVRQLSGFTVGAPTDTGANVTFTVAPALGASIVLISSPSAVQNTSLPSTGPFPAKSVETALDKLTLLVQRVSDLVSRSFTLSDTDTTTASTVLPSPASNALIGWNPSATALQNVDPQALATIVAFGTANADVFTGNGVQTAFTLTANPGAQANLDVAMGGVTQLPNADYTWTGGTTVTFTTAPANGVKVLMRYFQALPQGASDAGAVTYSNVGSYGLTTVGYRLQQYFSSLGSSLLGFIQSGIGAVARFVQDKLREQISVKDYGAKGDGVTDDWAAIQAAITDVCTNRRGVLYFPANDAGQFYKVSAPLVISSAIKIRGAGENFVTVYGSGLSAGQHIFDFDCLAANTVENVELSDMTIRSNNGAPNGSRLKNVSYMTMRNIRFYNVAKGCVITGTRTYSNEFECVQGYTIGTYTVSFEAFNGGGNYTFLGCTFAGSYGFYHDNTSNVNQLAFVSCNFEACTTNSVRIEGAISGLSFAGCRTEACAGDDYVIYPSAANKVTGLSVTGCYFTANTVAQYPVVLGGNGGAVRGFNISGNTTQVGAQTALVRLNGEGESGVVSGNYIGNATGLPTSSQRAGVIVSGNENTAGKCAEYWGLSTGGMDSGTWTPIDGSGAALTFTAAGGRWTRAGRLVFWQASVTYPATGSGSAAEIGGLPFVVGGLSGASEGRAGAGCSYSNLGSLVTLRQGLSSNTKVALYNPTTGATLTNTTVSGKTFEIYGTYSL